MPHIKYEIQFHEYNNKSKSLSGGKTQDGPQREPIVAVRPLTQAHTT
jgi:hypothetical protein